MAMNATNLATELKNAVKSLVDATLEEGEVVHSAQSDAFYAALAQALVTHIQSNAEVVGGGVQ